MLKQPFNGKPVTLAINIFAYNEGEISLEFAVAELAGTLRAAKPGRRNGQFWEA